MKKLQVRTALILDPAAAAGYLGTQDLSRGQDIQSVTCCAPHHQPRPLELATVTEAQLRARLDSGQDLLLLVGSRTAQATVIDEAVLVIADEARRSRTETLLKTGSKKARARFIEVLRAGL